MGEPISFVKAMQDYFSAGDFGKKLAIPEFKALTREDREELRQDLIAQGYNVLPLPETVEA
jgi:uncharacterized protein YcgL (UPF0745 family)